MFMIGYNTSSKIKYRTSGARNNEKWQETHCFLENQKILNTKSLYQIKVKST